MKLDFEVLAPKLCDRHFGIGADGILAVGPSNQFRAKMLVYNADGSMPEMCGNGIRCAAVYLLDENLLNPSGDCIETSAGPKKVTIDESRNVTIDMGQVTITHDSVDLTQQGCSETGIGVSVGNPHLVIFVRDLGSYDLNSIGPKLEHHLKFKDGANVHFVQILSRSNLRVNTWERGSGVTLACGTGACACTYAALSKGLIENVCRVELPGGRLTIEIDSFDHALMTGPAEYVFFGNYSLPIAPE